MKHRRDDYQIFVVVDFVDNDIWQTGDHPLKRPRRLSFVTHARELSKTLCTGKNAIDYSVCRAWPILVNP